MPDGPRPVAYDFSELGAALGDKVGGYKHTITHPDSAKGCSGQTPDPGPEPPGKCPLDASGEYPNCSCPVGYTYDSKKNDCVKDKDTGPGEPNQCPSDASGTYPNCTCPVGYTYDKDKNDCIAVIQEQCTGFEPQWPVKVDWHICELDPEQSKFVCSGEPRSKRFDLPVKWLPQGCSRISPALLDTIVSEVKCPWGTSECVAGTTTKDLIRLPSNGQTCSVIRNMSLRCRGQIGGAAYPQNIQATLGGIAGSVKSPWYSAENGVQCEGIDVVAPVETFVCE
ncbi:MAG: hypothetical protein EBS81_11765 [Gammaproteobacteria bacterium]|nr:hypothetical protein [Gammaproteobacteria bacterium]